MRLQTTGSFAVYSSGSGEDVTPRSRKARALVAYLTSNPGAKVPKYRIAALLWGECGDSHASASLRQVLRELRITVNRLDQFVLSSREHIWVSVDSFIEKPADPSAPPRDSFEDLDNITPEFDEWLSVERSRRVATKIVALEHRAEQLLGEGRGAESVVIVNEMQALDPSNENALELGMKVEFQHGHPGQIARRFKETADHLKADLGVDPSTSSRDLRDRLIARLTSRKTAAAPLETDHDYFVRRAREERMAATSAASDVTRQAHEAIAARYESMYEALKP